MDALTHSDRGPGRGRHALKPAEKSFWGYVEFDAPPSAIKLALYSRRAAAKDAGVPAEGTGSHRLVVGTDDGAFTDPDGFAWESVPSRAGSGG